MDDAIEALAFRNAVLESWWKLLKWLKIGKEKKLAEAWKTFDHFANHHFSMRRDVFNKSKSQAGELDLNLMLAGRDTTSAALTWFFCLVSMNLHAALYESLRLDPPVPFEQASVLRPEVLPSGEAVRPGTKILIPFYTMARMESIWGKDCLEFKPARWITEKGKLKFEPSYKFMAFHSGPRICLGKVVAFTQMKSVAATLLFNFHFQVLEGHPVSPTLSIIQQMEKGLMVRVRQRHPDAFKQVTVQKQL